MRRMIFIAGVMLILFLPLIEAKEVSGIIVGEPPQPFMPDPANQYNFPAGTAVSNGDAWLNLPPIDYTPPPYARYLKGLRICLDPGHGGDQNIPNYKATASGYKESIMNLTVANHLKDFLLKSGAIVILTRDGDYDLSKDDGEALAARPRVAEVQNADFFISMHHNAHGSKNTSNFPSAFYHAFPGYIYSNVDLGRAITSELEYWMRLPDFGGTGLYSDYLIFNNAGFGVLRRATVPAILIEASFFDVPEEEARLKDPEYLKREAWAYYMGIVKYVRDGVPKAELVFPENGILTGSEHKLEFRLPDGCPEGWGSKDWPRIVKWSINMTINDLDVPFEYNERTGILTYRPPMPFPPGQYDVLIRYVNVRKNSNIPKIFKINVQP